MPIGSIGRRVVRDSGGPGARLRRRKPDTEEEARINRVSSLRPEDSGMAVPDDSSFAGKVPAA